MLMLVVTREGFEPPTPALGRRRSCPLSYRAIRTDYLFVIISCLLLAGLGEFFVDGFVVVELGFGEPVGDFFFGF